MQGDSLLFQLRALRFMFRAEERLSFPPGAAANILRGALGLSLSTEADLGESSSGKRLSDPSIPPPDSAYKRLFAPQRPHQSPSGLRDSPRPFVLRARHLNGRTIDPGDCFSFDVHLFLTDSVAASDLIAAFSRLGQTGLGAQRSLVVLEAVRYLDRQGKPCAGDSRFVQAADAVLPIEFDLRPGTQEISAIHLDFVTPTELKGPNGLAALPDFPTLAGRVRDRLSTLRALYGAGPLAIDFREFHEQAQLVTLASCEIQSVDARRRSTRTGQVHSIGGFTGSADYAGPLTAFVPFLEAAQWTGVGRQTVWGKGEFRVSLQRDQDPSSRSRSDTPNGVDRSRKVPKRLIAAS